MSLLNKVFGKEEKTEDYFARNRNVKIMAKTTMPEPEEIKQEEAEKGE